MMTEANIHTAMDVQVPAMRQRGFSICTFLGQVDIPAGWIADRMAQQLTQHLQCELLRCTKERYHQQPRISGADSHPTRRKADQHGH